MDQDTTIHGQPPAFLTEREVAWRWRIGRRTLQRWRLQGRGPEHLRIGTRVLYPLSAVLAFETARLALARAADRRAGWRD